MTRPIDFPKPRDFPGDGIRIRATIEGGTTAKTRPVRRRLVQDGSTRYRAYSADELIELDSLAHHGRPGHLHG